MIARGLTVLAGAWLLRLAAEQREDLRRLRMRVASLEHRTDLRGRVAALENEAAAVRVAARAYIKALNGWRGA